MTAAEGAERRGIDGVELRSLFDTSAVPMVVLDDDRRWVDANPAACALLGLARRDLIGRTMDDLTPLELRPDLDRLWQRLMRGRTLSGAFRFVLPDGRALPFDYSAVANVGRNRHFSVIMPSRRGSEPPLPARDGRGSLLSAREREILRRVALGQDGPQIARDLVVSPATVRTHIGNAIRKLGARSRGHAIAIALRGNLLD